MGIEVAHPDSDELLAELHRRIEHDLDDPGYVLSTGEYVRDNSMAARALRREGRRISGIHIMYLGQSESKGADEDEFFNTIEHRFKLRIYRQYEDNDLADDLMSAKWVRRAVNQIASILRTDSSLGFGDEVEFSPIQMPEDIDNDSNEQLGTFHVAPIDVYVKHTVFPGSCG